MKYLYVFFTLLIANMIACEQTPPFVERSIGEYNEDGIYDKQESSLDPKKKRVLAEWSFEASEIAQTTLEYNLSSETMVQHEVMNFVTEPASFEFRQKPSHQQQVDVYKLNSSFQNHREFFKQNERDDIQGLLDILVVIDNSGSMEEEQINLANKLMPLLSYVKHSDWQIAVTTTDMEDPSCARDLIRKGQENAESAYMRAIRAGINGSGLEAGIPRAVRALSSSCLNGWLRPGSALAVLIVSDEDNCSNGLMCRPAYYNSADYLYNHLETIRKPGIDAKVFGLIWHPSQESIDCQTGFRKAYIYSQLIQSTQGRWGSICDRDYSETLAAMSFDLSLILKPQFALKYTPTPDSIVVYVNDQLQVLERDYLVNENVLEFTEVPPAGARILVSYEHKTSEPQKVFTLSHDGNVDHLKVFVDGARTYRYTFDPSNHQVLFQQAPSGSEVKILYDSVVELKKEFMTEAQLMEGHFLVYIDGTLIPNESYKYNEPEGVVSFKQAPIPGQLIKIESLRVRRDQLRFELMADGIDPSRIRVRSQNGRILSHSFTDGFVWVTPELSLMGEEFTIEWAAPRLSSIKIPYDFDPSSIQVSGSYSGLCRFFMVEGDSLDFEQCRLLEDEVLILSFSYVVSHKNSFKLTHDELPPSYFGETPSRFAVWVNGIKTDGFYVKDQRLHFVNELDLGSQVRVVLSDSDPN